MSNTVYDIVIIGGGPAALSAAVYAGRAVLRTVIFEKKVTGGQILTSTLVDNYPGFPDGISGAELTELMESHAKKFGAEIKYEEVTGLKVESDTKIVTTDSGTYNSPIVILASGADPRKLGVPGEDEFVGRGVSYCGTCDGPFYKDKDVVVAGGGDSAITEGLFITKFAKAVHIVHRRAELTAAKIFQDEARANPRIRFVWNSAIEKISGSDKVEGVTIKNLLTNERKDLSCQGVFVFVGNVPNTGFLGDLLCVDQGCHIETDENMETAIKGIYAVGDIRKNSYRQLVTAAGEGAIAAIAA
ncbi:MAG TPA: thioredoxin-disulfide reductase, partial [Candidatus Brocadiales bacterium]|nr:thioredoxin-disulfide reductase [Candidatus Brocadiales bacterium]